jgi:hypothetical protein
MFNQEDGDRHGDVALTAFHQMGELAGYSTASEGVELDHDRRLSSVRPA